MTGLLATCLVLVAVLAWPRRQSDADLVWSSPATRGSSEQSSSAGRSSTAGGPDSAARQPPQLSALLRRRRRRRHDLGAVLGVLDALAPALRAGLAPVAALGCLDFSVGRSPRVSALLTHLIEAAELGEPLAPVWMRQARDIGSVELALIGRAWALSESLGAPLADCVAMAADLVRQRTAREQRLAVAIAGPRATTTVLSLLPLGGPGVALLLGITPSELYSTAAAFASVLVGLVLLAVGRWWCARMVRGLARPRPPGEGWS